MMTSGVLLCVLSLARNSLNDNGMREGNPLIVLDELNYVCFPSLLCIDFMQ